MGEDANTEHIKSLLGKRIRLLRRQRNLTQAQLAEAMSMSEDLVGLVERGITAPSFSTLIRLASALSVSISELFTDEDATNHEN